MNKDSQSEEVTWPYATLIMCGFFGVDSPGGKILATRTTVALVIFLISSLILPALNNHILEILSYILIPSSLIYILWSYKEYLGGLDELSQLIQYKAIAISYGIVVVVGMTFLGLEVHSEVSLSLLPIYILMAEGFRGFALGFIAKEYS